MSNVMPRHQGQRKRDLVDRARLAVRRLIADHPITGITNRMVQHAAQCDSNHAGTVLAKMTHEGEIHGARIQHVPKHWFGTAEAAQHWLAQKPGQVIPEPVQRPPMLNSRFRPKTTRSELRLCQPGLPAPVTLSNDDQLRRGDATVPAHVRVQIGPSVKYDPRYQIDPTSRPFGAGFAAAGIGRDITTGRTWAERSDA